MSSPRLSDRRLVTLLVVAAGVLLLAIGFAAWINTDPPLTPVPVRSSGRA